MIAIADLRQIARAHLRAAVALSRSKNYDAAVYLCGYAVEIALKARICRTLKWTGFPATTTEFQYFRSLQTHHLETLLRFSGIEGQIKPAFLADWLRVTSWNPEQRYNPVGSQTAASAQDMIDATRRIVKVTL